MATKPPTKVALVTYLPISLCRPTVCYETKHCTEAKQVLQGLFQPCKPVTQAGPHLNV